MTSWTSHFPVDPKHLVLGTSRLPHIDVVHVAFDVTMGGLGIGQCAADGENLGGKIISASWWIKGPWVIVCIMSKCSPKSTGITNYRHRCPVMPKACMIFYIDIAEL